MRIEVLHLERYGLFENLSLDLSNSQLLLHIVHGPNEAGKSTALAAISDLFFGIPDRTPYAFRHDYGQLRIGATIVDRAGRRLTFKRRKGRQNTLLAPDETSAPESSLAPFLGGVDREFFERMFGLDHTRLRAAGGSMLETGGDLANSLFEAGAGIANVLGVLTRLNEEAESFGSPHRRAGGKPLWRAIDAHEDASKRMREEALRVDEWTTAVKAMQAEQDSLRTLEEGLTELRRRRTKAERVRRIQPLLTQIDQLARRVGELANVPGLPVDFEDAWRRSVQAVRDAREHERNTTAAVARLHEERVGLGDPGPWCTWTKEIEDLYEKLGAVRREHDDLPKLERDLAIGSQSLVEAMARLGVSHGLDELPARVPPRPLVARVRTYMMERARLDAELTAADGAVAKARELFERSEAELAGFGEPTDPSEAGAALREAAKFGDVEARVAAARLESDEAKHELDLGLGRLGRWNGIIDKLVGTACPSVEAVLRYERSFADFAKERLGLAKDLEHRRAEARRIDAELATITATGAVPTSDAVQEARRRRDRGWRLIRRHYVDGVPVPEAEIVTFAPEGDPPGTYEAAVREADGIVDRKAQEADRIARYATLTGQRAEAAGLVEQIERRLGEIDLQVASEQVGWQKLWATTGIEPAAPDEMRLWLQRKDEVLHLAEGWRKAEADVARVEAEARAARAHLLAAAAALTILDATAMDTPTLRASIAARYDLAETAWSSAKALQETRARHRLQLEAQKRELSAVRARMADWAAKWAVGMPLIGLASDAGTSEADAALDEWNRIAGTLSDLAQTRRRRDGIKKDMAHYAEAVRALLRRLGEVVADLDVEASGPMVVVSELFRRLDGAKTLADRIANLEGRIADMTKERDEAGKRAGTAEAEIERLRSEARLGPDDDPIALARLSVERARTADALANARSELASQGDGLAEDVLRAEAGTSDPDSVAAEAGRLDDETDVARRQLQTVVEAAAKAEAHVKALRDRTGIGEAAQTARDEALRAAECLEQWLRLRAAALILSRAVDRYRAANQHPLVRRASEIFAAVAGTGGNPILQLTADYGEADQPVLVGVRRDGTHVFVAGMSDGTRDQLHLALRIAAIERYLEGTEPLPFVADDLFITSDDARTLAGLRILAELGRSTQVLLFTHHQYVVDAARAVLLPETIRVHSL